MSSEQPTKPAEPRTVDLFAGLLSYLVPGLGQISQGRIGKGVLFMVSLLGMFFFGMYLGDWKNVYVPPDVKENGLVCSFLSRGLLKDVPGRRFVCSVADARLAYAGQFWIGVAGWPAILQYNDKWPASEKSGPFWHEFQRTPSERTLNDLQASGNKSWDLGWVYTVIAGVLNILVIYDALVGPAFVGGKMEEKAKATTATPQQQEVAAV
jgi:hypothetical protein